jgi:transcriptional regulator with XRE-family HTH domain
LRGFGTNQQEFGKKLGISQSMVSRLEKGEIPSVELLLKISEVCKKPTDWILKGKELQFLHSYPGVYLNCEKTDLS